MTNDIKHDEERKPYESPAVYELGRVAEVTHGAGTPGIDLLLLSA